MFEDFNALACAHIQAQHLSEDERRFVQRLVGLGIMVGLIAGVLLGSQMRKVCLFMQLGPVLHVVFGFMDRKPCERLAFSIQSIQVGICRLLQGKK